MACNVQQTELSFAPPLLLNTHTTVENRTYYCTNTVVERSSRKNDAPVGAGDNHKPDLVGNDRRHAVNRENKTKQYTRRPLFSAPAPYRDINRGKSSRAPDSSK